MSEPIKIKAPRTEKQVLALEKARTRAKEIRQHKIIETKKEIESESVDDQERINALNSRSTRFKQYRNSDSEEDSESEKEEEVEEKAEVIEKIVENPKRKSRAKPKDIPEKTEKIEVKPREEPRVEQPKEKPKEAPSEPKLFRLMNRHSCILFDED